jgi:hypothetical protein
LSALPNYNGGPEPDDGRVPSSGPDHHRCQAVIEEDGGYVLVCTCGWRTPESRSAAEVGGHWDRHRGD